MDKRSLSALEFPKILEALAERCVSEAGRASALALKPLESIDAVHNEQRIYNEACVWAESTGAMYGDDAGIFSAFPDCEAFFARMDRSSIELDADALFAVRTALSLAKKLVFSVREHEERWPALAARATAHPLPDLLISTLLRCLDDDANVRDTASPELMLIRGDLRRINQMCLRKVREFAVQYNITQYLQDEFMTLANDRFVLPLKTNFKGRVRGIIHDYSNTGETCYFEPLFLVEINNTLQELKQSEREEERKIFLMLTEMVRADLPAVKGAWDFLVSMDVTAAKIRLGEALNAVTVSPENDAPLNLIEARHPLLMLDKSMQKLGGPHPVDISLRGNDTALIITGGNAGGKTVCLKTLGIITVMILSALPVPVKKGSSLPWFSSVHAFIGDEQSLDDHVSTFTAQISSLSLIWDSLNSQSLVLLDEFGSGTDPSQGAALAQAVIDGLIDCGVYAAAATHFPALKTYALTRDRVRAASVLFDPNTKKPLFRLAYDQVGASLALDVAREHGLPESVLKRAEHYLLIDGQDSGALIERLNALSAQREKELDTLRAEQKKTREKRERCKVAFEHDRERLNTEVRAMAGELMRAWKEGKVTAKQALKNLSEIREKISSPQERDEPQISAVPDISAFKPGIEVMHTVFGKRVTVREADIKQNRVKIDMNGLSMWADPAILRLCDQPSVEPPCRGAVLTRMSEEKTPYMRLDVRGKRADEALAEIERFIDRSLLSGIDGADIVHGRGTGALRREVHAFLRSHPGIAGFAVANEDCGGDGVTVVTFR